MEINSAIIIYKTKIQSKESTYGIQQGKQIFTGFT